MVEGRGWGDITYHITNLLFEGIDYYTEPAFSVFVGALTWLSRRVWMFDCCILLLVDNSHICDYTWQEFTVYKVPKGSIGLEQLFDNDNRASHFAIWRSFYKHSIMTAGTKEYKNGQQSTTKMIWLVPYIEFFQIHNGTTHVPMYHVDFYLQNGIAFNRMCNKNLHIHVLLFIILKCMDEPLEITCPDNALSAFTDDSSLCIKDMTWQLLPTGEVITTSVFMYL